MSTQPKPSSLDLGEIGCGPIVGLIFFLPPTLVFIYFLIAMGVAMCGSDTMLNWGLVTALRFFVAVLGGGS
jgi:hypothetical protein